MMSTVKSITKSNVYLTKLAEDGYLEPTAVGATVGALTGSLAGGSLGISGGEMSLDTQKALNSIKADINKATNKIPLLKPDLMEITPTSRVKHMASGILKGMKYGAMAGIPLGGALFAYDNYRRNQEKKASVVNHLAHHAIDINLEQPPMNPYLQRVSDMQKEAETQTEGYLPTFIQDTRGGLIAASGLLGGAAGAAASVPHYLFKQAGVAEDQARAKIHEDNAVIRPYHIAMTPEINQAVESLAVGRGTHLAAKALSHVHPGFTAAAPGLGVAAGLLDATRLGDKLKADDAEKVRRYSAYIRNQAREDALQKQAQEVIEMSLVQNPYLVKIAEQSEYKPTLGDVATIGGGIGAAHGLVAGGVLGATIGSSSTGRTALSRLKNAGKWGAAGAALLAPIGAGYTAYQVHKDPSLLDVSDEKQNALQKEAADDSNLNRSLAGGALIGGGLGSITGASMAAHLYDLGTVTHPELVGETLGEEFKRLGKKVAKGSAVGLGVGSLAGAGIAGYKAMKKEAAENPYLLKIAEQAIDHDWKPALSAGAIDAAMGLGLGALGHHVSKKYFGGKYAPLIIGGSEGLLAMGATDLYQRKHEKEMAALKQSQQG